MVPMKKILALSLVLLAASAMATWATAADTTKGEWTGYITDSHCGEKGANKEHTADCVEKCMKGGSKAQLFNEADKKFYELDSFDKVKALVGSKVTIKGSLNAETHTITVDSATKSSQ
jgi:hypothetical protein